MNYIAYKLEFPCGVHFGKNSLTDSLFRVCADTIFSALCQEAVKIGQDKLEELVSRCKAGGILISDGLPYIYDADSKQDTLYVPKPIVGKQSREDGQVIDSVKRKAFNKLTYVPIDKLTEYLNGEIDEYIVDEQEKLSSLGKEDMRVLVNLKDGKMPYHLGTFSFNDGNGLYIVLGYETEADKSLFCELIKNLSYSGIGGKRSAGLGGFVVTEFELDNQYIERLNQTEGATFMTLSVSLPVGDENELSPILEEATYEVMKRSGFIDFEGQDKYIRKEDLYVFAAGSCFAQRYEGDIYNVGYDDTKVYRYAKPMFLQL
ncbi:MAG: type III-A CRISPR-associated RAMP protein Csm4 [Lachnospiraceae bacterium]|nr:type III-A CRISPR-associated RAMP protein Csm4 [Lachnospiraceae bacterium]